MPEEDWYGPFRERRWKGYLHFAGGAAVVALALAGFTFEKQVIVNGIAKTTTRLVFYGSTRKRSRAIMPLSCPELEL